MAIIYSDYSRARIGHFFGLSGWQLTVVALSLMPVFVSVNAGVVAARRRVRAGLGARRGRDGDPGAGRSATNWAATALAFAVGGLTGWTRFRSRRRRRRPPPTCACRPARGAGRGRDPRRPTAGPHGQRGSRSSRTTPPAPGRSPPPWCTPASG